MYISQKKWTKLAKIPAGVLRTNVRILPLCASCRGALGEPPINVINHDGTLAVLCADCAETLMEDD